MLPARLIVWGVLAAFAAAPGGASASFPGRNGQLAVDGEVMNPDGTGRRALVSGSSVAWSADGMHIAFAPSGGGVAIARADGSDVRAISTNAGDDNPAWSPDGERLAFSGPAFSGDFQTTEIFTMRADGSERRQLTSDPGYLAARVVPAWSPDGSTIAFAEHQFACPSRIMGVHPDGTPARVQVNAPDHQLGEVGRPDWSPRSEAVAFVRSNACSEQDGADLVAPSGAVAAPFNPTGCPLPREQGCVWFHNGTPAVSPDGLRMAYLQIPTGGPVPFGVHTVGVDGREDRLVAPNVFAVDLDWRPLPASPPTGVCDRPGARRGGAGRDVLRGSEGDDVLCGGAGADVLIGRGGHDVLVGGEGADLLLGGDGLDRLFADAGADTARGGRRDDILVGGPGRDILRGGDGADSLLSDRDGARDTVLCGAGPDLALADGVDTRRGCSP